MMNFLKRNVKSIFKNRFDSKNRIINDRNKITLSMIVKNEEGRYLEDVLKHAIKYVDDVLIIDDCSTDNTVEICKDILKNIPHKIIVNSKSLFHIEHKLRRLQWRETLKMNPDWIFFLDADEIFENEMISKSRELIKDKTVDIYNFRLYDMWNETHYREDDFWCAHFNYKTFLIRYQPKFKYRFNKFNHHCGRVPKDLHLLPTANSDIRLKHFGWSKLEDREKKYLRYKKMDPNGEYGNILQYESIMDESSKLILFK